MAIPDVRAPSQIYKWVAHNEYDDTKQKYTLRFIRELTQKDVFYSSVADALWVHYFLCSKGLSNSICRLLTWISKAILL